MHLDQPALKFSHIANMFQVAGENHHRERTDSVVLAKVQIVDPSLAALDSHYLACDAAGLADVVFGFAEGNAVSRNE